MTRNGQWAMAIQPRILRASQLIMKTVKESEHSDFRISLSLVFLSSRWRKMTDSRFYENHHSGKVRTDLKYLLFLIFKDFERI